MIGATAALYERIGRFDLPVRTMRAIFAGLILMNGVAVLDIYGRLESPLTWRTPAVIVSMSLYIGGLTSLWWYYRAPGLSLDRGMSHVRSTHVRAEQLHGGALDGDRKPTAPPAKPSRPPADPSNHTA